MNPPTYFSLCLPCPSPLSLFRDDRSSAIVSSMETARPHSLEGQREEEKERERAKECVYARVLICARVFAPAIKHRASQREKRARVYVCMDEYVRRPTKCLSIFLRVSSIAILRAYVRGRDGFFPVYLSARKQPLRERSVARERRRYFSRRT